MAAKILVVDNPESDGRDLSIEHAELGSSTEIVQLTYHDNRDLEKLVTAASKCDAVLTDFTPFDSSVIAQLKSCKLISISATGWDCIDLEAARKHQVSVCAVGEYCTEEVADHTLALILMLKRQLLDYHFQVQRDRSWAYDKINTPARLRGQTLGIIGFGRIGKAVASRAKSFGIEIIFYDPKIGHSDETLDAKRVSLETLFETSDIISLHCNADPNNDPIFSHTSFNSLMKKPILINVARGSLIDEHALAAALDAGMVQGAALDVLNGEPPKLEENCLLGRTNIVITPHIAFYSEHSIRDVRMISTRNIKYFLEKDYSQVNRFIYKADDIVVE